MLDEELQDQDVLLHLFRSPSRGKRRILPALLCDGETKKENKGGNETCLSTFLQPIVYIAASISPLLLKVIHLKRSASSVKQKCKSPSIGLNPPNQT